MKYLRTAAQLRVFIDSFANNNTGPKQIDVLSRFIDGEWKKLRDITNRTANEYGSVKAALAMLEGKSS